MSSRVGCAHPLCSKIRRQRVFHEQCKDKLVVTTMVDILKSLKKRVTFEHIERDGALLDMGISPSEVEALKKGRLGNPSLEFHHRLDEFKSKFIDGDELWYYEWILESFSDTGGYAIVRGGVVVASITSWRS